MSFSLQDVPPDLVPRAGLLRMLKETLFAAAQFVLLPLRDGQFCIASGDAVPEILNELNTLGNA